LGSLLWAVAVALPLGTGGGLLKRRRGRSSQERRRRDRRTRVEEAEAGGVEQPGTPAARDEEKAGSRTGPFPRATKAGGPGDQGFIAGEFTVVLTLPCGVTFDESGGRVVVIKVNAGSAGDRAGVAVGDVLVAVSRPDGSTTFDAVGPMDRIAGMPFDAVLDRIVEHDRPGDPQRQFAGAGAGAVGLTFERPAKGPPSTLPSALNR